MIISMIAITMTITRVMISNTGNDDDNDDVTMMMMMMMMITDKL